MGRRRSNAAQRFAIRALDQAATTLGPNTDVGRVHHLGTGLSRSGWGTSVQPVDSEQADWVALVPLKSATPQDHARFAIELELLDALTAHELPFRLPVPIGTFVVDDVPVHVVTQCGGLGYDRTFKQILTADLMTATIGTVAAHVHRLPTTLPRPDTSYTSARDHALASIAELRAVEEPFVADAVAWCTDNLPDPDAPARFLHGDLLGQNVLIAMDHPPAVIDWEYAKTGDPASDLAIVTRGKRKLFGDANGVQMLFDAYDTQAAQPLRTTHVRIHELALLAKQVTWSTQHEPHLRDHHLVPLQALWRRTGG